MPHILSNPTSFIGKAFKNSQGNAECVEFIKQTLRAPATVVWREGVKVRKDDSSIAEGTAIATFVNGQYPQTGATGMHAAIYLGQDGSGIQVVDQWASQGMVKQRTIRWNGGPNLSNSGSAFSVIEW